MEKVGLVEVDVGTDREEGHDGMAAFVGGVHMCTTRVHMVCKSHTYS